VILLLFGATHKTNTFFFVVLSCRSKGKSISL